MNRRIEAFSRESLPTAMSSKHLVSIFTKLKSFRQAGESVKELLASVLGDEEDRRDFLVEHYAATKKYKDEFASRTAVIVIDARQTRTLITPERRDKNVDHWDELRTLTDSFTFPKGSVLVIVYGDERSNDLGDDMLVANEWLTTWKYNDVIAYDLTIKKRCFSVSDKFNKGQTDRLREYFKLTIPLFIFYETRLNQCFVRQQFWQVAFQKIINFLFRVLRTQKILVSGTDDIPQNFDQYLHLDPFVVSAIQDETGNKSKITVKKYNYFGLSERRVVKVHLIKLPAERIKQHDRAQVHDLAMCTLKGRMSYAVIHAVMSVVSVLLMPIPIIQYIIQLTLRQFVFGLLTYDALAQVTDCEDCFVAMVDDNEDNTNVIEESGVSYSGKIFPIVQDVHCSSGKICTKLYEITKPLDPSSTSNNKLTYLFSLCTYPRRAMTALITLLLYFIEIPPRQKTDVSTLQTESKEAATQSSTSNNSEEHDSISKGLTPGTEATAESKQSSTSRIGDACSWIYFHLPTLFSLAFFLNLFTYSSQAIQKCKAFLCSVIIKPLVEFLLLCTNPRQAIAKCKDLLLSPFGTPQRRITKRSNIGTESVTETMPLSKDDSTYALESCLIFTYLKSLEEFTFLLSTNPQQIMIRVEEHFSYILTTLVPFLLLFCTNPKQAFRKLTDFLLLYIVTPPVTYFTFLFTNPSQALRNSTSFLFSFVIIPFAAFLIFICTKAVKKCTGILFSYILMPLVNLLYLLFTYLRLALRNCTSFLFSHFVAPLKDILLFPFTNLRS